MSGKRIGLAFAEDPDGCKLTSRWFPSKAGGAPALLEQSRKGLETQCQKCGDSLVFLCQIYAPGEAEEAFHRTIFLFGCSKESCCQATTGSFRAFRSQLPRKNEYYPYEPPQQSDEIDEESTQNAEGRFLPEFELIVEDEPSAEEALEAPKSSFDRKVLSLVKQFNAKHSSDKKDEEDDEFLNANEPETAADESFLEFEARISRDPAQVLRYARGTTELTPLWATDKGRLDAAEVPPCPRCQAPRVFEMQLMPQFLHEVIAKGDVASDMDFATVAVFTCSRDCAPEHEYLEEYVWTQAWGKEEGGGLGAVTEANESED